jgi:hypothetical protein
MGIKFQIVIYGAHRYRLIWLGKTRFGRRAHLEFLGAKPRRFWVPACKVAAAPELAARPSWETR